MPLQSSVAVMKDSVNATVQDAGELDVKEEQPPPPPVSKAASIMMVLVGGLALFSDGYNAQIVGYMNPVLAELYPDSYTKSLKTSMSNAFLIGEVFGMLFFGWGIDKLGRRSGIFWATAFLVLGIVLATAAHGTSNTGMFWMMIIGRGVAGFGAGGRFCNMIISCLNGAKTRTLTGKSQASTQLALPARLRLLMRHCLSDDVAVS